MKQRTKDILVLILLLAIEILFLIQNKIFNLLMYQAPTPKGGIVPFANKFIKVLPVILNINDFFQVENLPITIFAIVCFLGLDLVLFYRMVQGKPIYISKEKADKIVLDGKPSMNLWQIIPLIFIFIIISVLMISQIKN